MSWAQRRRPSPSLNTITILTIGTSTRVPTTTTTTSPPRCPPCLSATWSIGEQSHCNCIGCKATEIDECRHNLICPGWSAASSAALSPVPRFIIAVTSGCPRPGPRPGPPCGAPPPPATLPAGAGHTTIQQGASFPSKSFQPLRFLNLILKAIQ